MVNSDYDTPYLITYVDHVLFKNTDPGQVQNSIRTTVGWVVKQDKESVCISWDKPINHQENEVQCSYSGLSLVRKAILDIVAVSEDPKAIIPWRLGR